MNFRDGLFALVLFGLSAALFLGGPEEQPAVKADAAVLFTPEDQATEALSQVIDDARAEVLVAMYTLTNRDLGDALVRAQQRGVSVRLLVDSHQAEVRYSQVDSLIERGINAIKVSLGQTGNGIDIRYHNKFAVIDREQVVTGSFNWTQQADLENYENIVLLKSEKLARMFQEKFEEHWEAFSEE